MPGSLAPALGTGAASKTTKASGNTTAKVNEPAFAVWADAMAVVALLAVDREGLGGAVLRGLPGPARDRWLALLRPCLPACAAIRRVPIHVSEGRLLGGLDLGATLKAGRPVSEQGLLASIDGGVLLLTMAERLPATTAAIIAAALDRGEIRLERDGFGRNEKSRFAVVALDKSLDDEDRPSAALRDRLAFEVNLSALSHRDLIDAETDAATLIEARRKLPDVEIDDDLIRAMTGTAMALGIASLRAPLLALRTAAAAAALGGRRLVDADDAALAVRLVLAHRATRLPAEREDDRPQPEDPFDPEEAPSAEEGDDQDPGDRPLEDQLLEAAIAALPPGLLDGLRLAAAQGGLSTSAGKTGLDKKNGPRGRPAGVRAGKPGGGLRLSVIETLRAAAPWQPLRRRRRSQRLSARIDVRPDDFRVIRRKERRQTTTIFVVDASGSSAFERLAEAKGAIELLLAACYTRRDQVALLAFRGKTAELLLPPTRSLVRAKRSLAGLPGGGGTPLATAIRSASLLADVVRRRGETPLLVFLTDGRANITRDGTPGRKQALADALAMAKTASAAGGALVIDISNRPGPEAAALAAALDARYLPLPRADARKLSAMVTSAMRP